MKIEEKNKVVIKFAGDSGDGMQFLGYRFTDNTAQAGNDATNFPDFPSEIRAPRGTIAGVSGFQLQFGSSEVETPGDEFDVLVAMNAAALKTNLKRLNKGGIIIADIQGFNKKNLQLAGYISNPLEDESLSDYTLYKPDITRLTRETLKEANLGIKDMDKCRNMFVLGLLYWMYNRDTADTVFFLERKFKSKPEVLSHNLSVLKSGYNYGEIGELNAIRYTIKPAQMTPGKYRGIMGSHAISLGLMAAAKKSELTLFYGSYPITPASDILHNLSRFKNFNVRTFQAEDEIAAICSAIGASFAGALAVTGTSGPGMALKTEALGLAVMMEIPLVVINVQRGGPSTGLPTKTEQSDLLQAVYGRNGEAPVPVLSCSTPSDSFYMAFEACRIAVEHMTPVILLSDGYLANGAEAWKYPSDTDLCEIHPPLKSKSEGDLPFLPYKRHENLSRDWVPAGTPGFRHRLGGLEKENETGLPSTDPDNHQNMVNIRQDKVNKICLDIPKQEITLGKDSGDLLVLTWGSTKGVAKESVKSMIHKGLQVSLVHISYLYPFPSNLGDLLKGFKEILVVEMNHGQLVRLIRDRYLVDAKSFYKIKGQPISHHEFCSAIENNIKVNISKNELV